MLLCPRPPGRDTFLLPCAAPGLRKRVPGCTALAVLATKEDREIGASRIHVHQLLIAGRNDAAQLYDDRGNLKSTATTSYAAAVSAIGMRGVTFGQKRKLEDSI